MDLWIILLVTFVGVFGLWIVQRTRGTSGIKYVSSAVRPRSFLIGSNGSGEIISTEQIGYKMWHVILEVGGQRQGRKYHEDDLTWDNFGQILAGTKAPRWIEKSSKQVNFGQYNQDDYAKEKEKVRKLKAEKRYDNRRRRHVEASRDRQIDKIADIASRLATAGKQPRQGQGY